MTHLRVLILASGSDPAEPSNARELAEQLIARSDVGAAEVLAGVSGRKQRLGRLLPAAALGAIGRGRGGIVAQINTLNPHVVVSWDAGLLARLAALRSSGANPIPLVGAAGNLHELEHLSRPGVDLYLLAWPADRAAAEAVAGAGRVAIVAAPLDPAFLDPPAHGSSRGWVARQFKVSLKGGRPLIVVGGGAAGAGDIAGTVKRALRAVPDAAVVALAGDRPEFEAELTADLAEIEQARVLGASDRLATLLAAADVLVDTAGTAGLEAAAVGCPVVEPGGGLEGELQAVLEADRPEPVSPAQLPSAADAVVAAAYQR